MPPMLGMDTVTGRMSPAATPFAHNSRQRQPLRTPAGNTVCGEHYLLRPPDHINLPFGGFQLR